MESTLKQIEQIIPRAPLTTNDLESFGAEVRVTLQRKLSGLVDRACVLRRVIGANRKEVELARVEEAIDELRSVLSYKMPTGVAA